MPEEIDRVRQCATKLHEKHIAVMIGCGPAVFGLAVMEQRKDAPELWIVDNNPEMFGYAIAHFEGAALEPTVMDRIIFVEGNSPDVGREWSGSRGISLLIVDGDHSYEGVKADLDAWLPHVLKGRYVFIHDYFERPGGFDGTAAWTEGGCARAVSEAIVDGRLISHGPTGIGILCERL
jgi:hypothetical protein